MQLTQNMERLANEIVLDPEKLHDFARQWAGGFRQYSFSNLILILWQHPGSTLCAGYRQWEKHGRQVLKGEKGLKILAPWVGKRTEVDKDTGEETEQSFMRFFAVNVFDVSQTEGEELDIGHSDAFEKTDWVLQDVVKLFGYPMYYDQGIANGHTDGKKIGIAPRKNKTSEVAYYFHELAHCELGHMANHKDVPHDVQELEAEAASYLVCSILGIKHEKAALYIGHWHGTAERLGLSGARILKCAEKITKKVLEVK